MFGCLVVWLFNAEWIGSNRMDNAAAARAGHQIRDLQGKWRIVALATSTTTGWLVRPFWSQQQQQQQKRQQSSDRGPPIEEYGFFH